MAGASLEALYPIIWLDASSSKSANNRVMNKAVYLVLGVNLSGNKELLGLWIAQTEGPSSG